MLQVNVGMIVYPEYEVNVTHSLFHCTEDFEKCVQYYVCVHAYRREHISVVMLVYVNYTLGITFRPSMSSRWFRLWRKVMMHK
jgi:hypothetical protein